MTKLTEGTKSLKKILDLWDHWESVLQEERNRREGEGVSREREDSRIHRITGDILRELDRDGSEALGSLRNRHRLEADEIFIVLLLLKQMISDSNPRLKGRQILNFFYSGSFEILRATRFLAVEGPLRSLRIVEASSDGSNAADPMETEFKLSDDFFRRVCRDVNPGIFGRPNVVPFGDNLEYLLELKSLAMLYRRRALHLFRGEDWDEPLPVPQDLELGILEKSSSIDHRVARTQHHERFPAIAFREKHRLSEEEMMVVVTLLFQELFTGNGFFDVVDLVKLVSRSERDLVEKRALFAPSSTLLGKDILTLEEGMNTQDVSGEVCVAAWAIDALLGDVAEGRSIDADSKLEFHEYLKRIEDSGDFFRKLRLPPESEA